MTSYERIIAVVFAVALALAGALGANAQGNAQGNAQAYEAALAGFTKDSFNDTDSAIGAVAASGSPLSLQVIEALQDGRLAFSGDKVFIRDKAGTVLDAATGKPARKTNALPSANVTADPRRNVAIRSRRATKRDNGFRAGIPKAAIATIPAAT